MPTIQRAEFERKTDAMTARTDAQFREVDRQFREVDRQFREMRRVLFATAIASVLAIAGINVATWAMMVSSFEAGRKAAEVTVTLPVVEVASVPERRR